MCSNKRFLGPKRRYIEARKRTTWKERRPCRGTGKASRSAREKSRAGKRPAKAALARGGESPHILHGRNVSDPDAGHERAQDSAVARVRQKRREKRRGCRRNAKEMKPRLEKKESAGRAGEPGREDRHRWAY